MIPTLNQKIDSHPQKIAKSAARVSFSLFSNWFSMVPQISLMLKGRANSYFLLALFLLGSPQLYNLYFPRDCSNTGLRNISNSVLNYIINYQQFKPLVSWLLMFLGAWQCKPSDTDTCNLSLWHCALKYMIRFHRVDQWHEQKKKKKKRENDMQHPKPAVRIAVLKLCAKINCLAWIPHGYAQSHIFAFSV